MFISQTRFGPNRPAAENKGDGGVDFWVDLECFIACFYLLPIQMPVFPISESTVFI